MSRPSRWLNCEYRRTSYEKKTSTCEPNWKPAGPNDRESLLAPFLLPVPAKANRQLHQMISTSRKMMSYHPAVPHPPPPPPGPFNTSERREGPLKKKAASPAQPVHQCCKASDTEATHQRPTTAHARSAICARPNRGPSKTNICRPCTTAPPTHMIICCIIIRQ